MKNFAFAVLALALSSLPAFAGDRAPAVDDMMDVPAQVAGSINLDLEEGVEMDHEALYPPRRNGNTCWAKSLDGRVYSVSGRRPAWEVQRRAHDFCVSRSRGPCADMGCRAN